MTKLSELVYWNIRRPLQRLPYKVAWLLPRWLVYFASIRLIAHATTGKHGSQRVTDLGALDALERWGHE